MFAFHLLAALASSPWMTDPTQSPQVRAAALLAKMTQQEKIAMVCNVATSSPPASFPEEMSLL
jgi:hypothetical protein